MLCYYGKGGFTHSEVYNMPRYLRSFYLKQIEKITNQRNEAHNRIAQLELVIESLQRENQNLKNSIEGNKIFKENKKDK